MQFLFSVSSFSVPNCDGSEMEMFWFGRTTWLQCLSTKVFDRYLVSRNTCLCMEIYKAIYLVSHFVIIQRCAQHTPQLGGWNVFQEQIVQIM
jgi:hypothetical protein